MIQAWARFKAKWPRSRVLRLLASEYGALKLGDGKKIEIPEGVDELEELMNDQGKVGEIQAAGQFPALIKAYAKATDDRGSIADQVAEQVKANLAGQEQIGASIKAQVKDAFGEFMTDHGVPKRPPMLGPGDAPSGGPSGAAANAAYNPTAPGIAMNDLGFVNIGDFAKTIWHKNPAPDMEKLNKVKEVQNAYSSIDPALGGFLIPEEQRSEILQLALEKSIVRPLATVITMSSLTQLMPFVDSTTNVGSVMGGMIFYWTDEAEELIATEAKFGRVKLEANKLTGLAAIPNELWADAPALSSFLMQAVPKGLAFYEDTAFISGTGTGEPLGFLNSPAIIAITKESEQLADTIVLNNVLNMFARMIPGSHDRAVWITNQNTFKELMTLSIPVGTGGAPVALVDIRSAPLMTMLGRPLIISEKVPTLGDQGDLVFVDLSYYLIGDRQAVSLETSEHVYFTTDRTALRVKERVDGRPWIQSAFQPANGDTVSPFVAIEART
jgi:HK97 family phage major capsid protein